MKNYLTESEILELYRVSLENALNQREIFSSLSELGYDSERIGQGRDLLAKTLKAYSDNKDEDDESSEAYSVFVKDKSELEAQYRIHRKKSKVVFRKDALMCERLGITGVIPKSYVKKIESIKKYYSIVSGDEAVQAQLERLKVLPEEVSGAQTLIDKLEMSRLNYLKERGESQDATQIKDAAFVVMDDWMSEFYAVARIALEDRPQLLEALGKVVKG
ncbi:hypothetical protein E9993_00985 [Labilibacter sediminis]|nr:hypothetical protein E9993_00985 [Labilibacter sediminis]